jgi:hypothetical protein
MSSARRPLSSSRAVRAWTAALLLAGVAAAGCFKPNIKDGGFRCNKDAGPGKDCPEGFRCNADQFCVKNPGDGGVDKVDGPVDADGGGDAGPPPPPCYDARPNCTPGPGMCDPFCQTGCGCREKCSINTMENLTCEPVGPGPTPPVYGNCVFQSAGSPNQTDNCVPGQVCVEDNCAKHCYQFCRSDNDCTNAACDREVVDGGQKVCDVPYVDNCVPLPIGNTGCTGGNTISCYLSSTHPDRTLCDCPAGAGGSDDPCKHSRDCVRGLACVDRPDGNPPRCLQVCDRTATTGSAACNSNPNACHPYYGNPMGTVAHPRYGYCF